MKRRHFLGGVSSALFLSGLSSQELWASVPAAGASFEERNRVLFERFRRPDEKTAAICGLFCGICPFYPEKCHGCLSDKLTAHCVECPNGFRKCAKEHGVTRCYECVEFPCARLQKFKKEHYQNGKGHHEQVIEDLTFMKEKGVKAWLEKKIDEYKHPDQSRLKFWYE